MNNDISANLTLISVKSDQETKYLLSTQETTLIGRASNCQIVLNPDEFITVSRYHAQIKLLEIDGQFLWQITDKSTTNGTLVNGEKITAPHQLQSGDRIMLGLKGPEFIFETEILNPTVFVSIPENKDLNILDTINAQLQTTAEPIVEIKEEKVAITSESIVEIKEEKVAITPEPIVEIKEEKVAITPEPIVEIKEEKVAITPEPIVEIKEEKVAITPEPIVEIKEEKVAITPESVVEIKEEKVAITPESIVEIEEENPKKVLSTVTLKSNESLFISDVSNRNIWTLLNLQEVGRISVGNEVNSIVFSPDGKTLATAGSDKLIKLWDLSTKEEFLELSGHKLAINAVVFSPDGKTLATASSDKLIKLWDLSTKEEFLELSGHKLAVNAVVFSPDGKTLATAGSDKLIKLWDLSTKEERISLNTKHTLPIHSLVFSSDGQMLLSSGDDRSVKVFQTSTGEELFSFNLPMSKLKSLSISSIGNVLASLEESDVVFWCFS